MQEDWQHSGPLEQICSEWKNKCSGISIMLLLLVQIAFRTTTRMPRSARSNYFLAVSGGWELKWILCGMWTLCWEEREAATVVKDKKKNPRTDSTNSRWLDIYPVVNHHSSRLTEIYRAVLFWLLERIRVVRESNGNWPMRVSQSSKSKAVSKTDSEEFKFSWPS